MAALTTVIGREDDLAALRTRFASDRVQVLAGMGGVGKTSLARAYAHRHRNDYRLVWWIRAEDPAAIDTEFRSLLDVLLPPGDSAKVGDARAFVFTLLAQQHHPWLLVLDNVPDPAAANGLLPPTGRGHVLITSRATGWPGRSIVEPLDTNAAVELLVSQSGDDDPSAVKALALELGGLPLALTQAASYTRTAGVDLATYLRWYRDKSALLHKEGRPADYPDTVATTWQLAMDRLSPNAKALLNLLAFYAPDAIPVHLLLPTATMSELQPLTDEFTRHQAVRELCTYSLIAATSNAVTVHRLVQLVTRNRLRDVDVWADAARKLIDEAIPAWPATAPKIATWNTLHTHVHAILDHLPPEDPATLTTRHKLARGIGETGDPAQARDLLSELLPIRERVLGAEHHDTLATRHEHADWTGEVGDAAQARDLFAELLPVLERVLGPEHQDTLRTRGYLVRWTGNAGEAAQARDQGIELLAIRERVLGAEHPDTLTTRHNLAIYTGVVRGPARARDQFTELLPLYERVLGAEHPNTLTTRHNLANWTGDAGDAAQARDMLAELLPLYERVLGAEHPDTLTTRHNLAYHTGEAGEPARARDMLAELLPIRERVLGTEHPGTLITRQVLEYWRRLAGVGEVGPGGGGEGEGGAGGVFGVADGDG